MIGCIYSIAEYLFQVETQVVSILDITLKRCSSALKISAFHTLHDCQGYANLACHFHSRKPFHSPHVSKPSTHAPNVATAIRFPRLRGQEKYDIIVNMRGYL
jgi:hypothetical protein